MGRRDQISIGRAPPRHVTALLSSRSSMATLECSVAETAKSEAEIESGRPFLVRGETLSPSSSGPDFAPEFDVGGKIGIFGGKEGLS